ncbi:MAG: transporter [Ferruginibacter sp.]
MKKSALLLFILLAAFSARACDICGCGAGNSYIGILPDFQKQIAGLRYRYNAIQTHVGVGGGSTYLTTSERYYIMEAWAGRNIGKNFRVMASLPYSFNEKTNQGNTGKKNGPSDASVAGFYKLLNSRKAVGDNKLLVQSLWIGAAVKFATGKYNPEDKSAGTNNANLFQLGTGSTDFNLSAMYDVRLQDAGINVNGSYKINTANKYEYRYGDKLSFSTQAYYKFNIKKICTLAPNAGLQYESSKNDLDNGFRVTASGGNLLLGTLGVEASFRKIIAGANFQTPLQQDLAKGIVKANNRMMLHVGFVF